MAGTPNPTAKVVFGNGNLRTLPDLGDSVILLVGPSTGGPFNRPRRASQMATVLNFLAGPLVGQGSHHVTYSQPLYVSRCRYTTPGTFGTVEKTAVGSSPGSMTVGVSSFSVHSQVAPNGAPMSLTSGWILPPYPMPGRITTGVGAVATVFTVFYINEEGKPKTETVNAPAAGTYVTTGLWKQVTKITSDVDPQAVVDFNVVSDGPCDRFDVQWRWVTGGQVSGGFAQPIGQWSGDNGRTWSRTIPLPSSGLLDLYTYAGGLPPQATGIRLTFAAGATGVTEFGSVRMPGADVNGDLVWTTLKLGVTVQLAVAGLNTPLSFGPAGDAVVVNLATNGAGNPTTTAAQLKAFLDTDATAPTAAARARLRLRTVGTGATVLAAVAATPFANSHVTWTAKREGLSLTVVEQGVSQTWKVQVGLSDVVIYLDTDANGIRTTTAQQMVDRVALDAKASTYLSGVASGAGTGLAGDTVGKLKLVTAFDAGDLFAFGTTPPLPSNADWSEALLALQKRSDIMDNITGIVFAKEGADGSDFTTLHQQLDVFADPLRRYYFGILGAPLMGTTDEDTWVTNTQARYPNRGTKISIVAGEIDTVLPAYGTESRRNFATLYAARLMNCPISVDPGAFECDTVNGTKYALDGTGNHLVPGGDPDRPEYTAFYQSEDALVSLHSANMVTPRSWPKVSGVFVRQGVQYVEDGDDWTFIMNRRIGDIAATLAYLETLRIINQTLLTDEQTGKLAEVVHQAIEANVRSYVGGKLLDDNGRRHITAIEVISDRSIDFKRTFSVDLALNIVGKDPAIKITTTINVVRTLTVNPGANASG